jgi:hypothetical protein
LNFAVAGYTLAPQEISFLNDILILQDEPGIVPVPVNDPVAYVKGNTMRVNVTFDVINPPPNPVSGVTIEGVIANLGAFKKTGVTIPSSGTLSITDVDLDAPLPSTGTKFYNPMTIEWRHMPDGNSCPSCTTDGSTQHKVYVTFATPIVSPVFLTSLHLAVSNDGATTQQEVFDKTWAHFTTGQVETWQQDLLTYYGADFNNTAICLPGDDGVDLMTSTNRAGQCTCFAELLLGALRVNGIGETGPVSAVRQRVVPSGAAGMLVFNWNYNGSGSNTAPFAWSMDFPTSLLGEMQPEPTGGVYAEVTNVAGIPGQNIPTPQEKVFGNHVFVKTTGIAGGPYFDPSYGVFYADEADFETKAIKGWAATHDPTDPLKRLRVRLKGTGSLIVFQ